MSTRDNPRGLPDSELVPVVRRSGDSANDWQSARVDPALVKPVKRTIIPRHGMTQAQVEEYNEQLRAAEAAGERPAEDETGFPENIHEDPER